MDDSDFDSAKTKWWSAVCRAQPKLDANTLRVAALLLDVAAPDEFKRTGQLAVSPNLKE
jgi:hypothetical protein